MRNMSRGVRAEMEVGAEPVRGNLEIRARAKTRERPTRSGRRTGGTAATRSTGGGSGRSREATKAGTRQRDEGSGEEAGPRTEGENARGTGERRQKHDEQATNEGEVHGDSLVVATDELGKGGNGVGTSGGWFWQTRREIEAEKRQRRQDEAA